MNRVFRYQITEGEAPCFVGDYLKAKGYSRQIIIQLKKTVQGISVNGKWAYVRTKLCAGDLLTVTLTESQGSQGIVPVALPLSLVYEDEDLLVVNKPADMPVHPSIHNYTNTLANGIAYYFQEQGESFVFRCINRLDRDTTGLLLLGKNALSASLLSGAMKNREIHRTYLAAVSGVPVPSKGRILAPIGRKPGSAIERQVDFDNGERAVTSYEVLSSHNGISLVRLSLETGRTHQIRVHMKYLGYPLLGDYLYNPDFSKISRVSLHSHALAFAHPISGKPLVFHAPLPKDIAGLFS